MEELYQKGIELWETAEFLENTPATVIGGELVACPLARLRDTEQAGVHTHYNSGVKRSVSVSEYIYADYPIPPLQRFIQGFAGGYYNRYYLTEMEDGSWLCVYFDDYLALTGGKPLSDRLCPLYHYRGTPDAKPDGGGL